MTCPRKHTSGPGQCWEGIAFNSCLCFCVWDHFHCCNIGTLTTVYCVYMECAVTGKPVASHAVPLSYVLSRPVLPCPGSGSFSPTLKMPDCVVLRCVMPTVLVRHWEHPSYTYISMSVNTRLRSSTHDTFSISSCVCVRACVRVCVCVWSSYFYMFELALNWSITIQIYSTLREKTCND